VNDWQLSRPNSRVLQLAQNVGFVGACNEGLEIADGKYVVLVNSDTCATDGWCRLFEDCFESDPRIGIASPLSNFCPHNSVPMRPGKTLTEMALAAMERKPKYPDITTCEGFFFAIRRTVIDQTGFLDGIFGAGYCEESDFCMRANYFGWRTVLVDNCYVFHYGRESFGSAVRQALYEKNKRVFYDRWRERYKMDFDAMNSRDAITQIRASLASTDEFQPVKWVD